MIKYSAATAIAALAIAGLAGIAHAEELGHAASVHLSSSCSGTPGLVNVTYGYDADAGATSGWVSVNSQPPLNVTSSSGSYTTHIKPRTGSTVVTVSLNYADGGTAYAQQTFTVDTCGAAAPAKSAPAPKAPVAKVKPKAKATKRTARHAAGAVWLHW
jgi:hypothetical protein